MVAASVEQLSDNVDAYESQFEKFVNRIDEALPAPLRERLVAETQLEALWQVPVEAVGSLLVGTTNAILQILSKSLLVLIFVIFLMVGGDARAQSSGVWGEVEGRITRYLVIKALVSMATGILVGVTLAILGVELAIVFGLFALLLNFIPNIGSIVATFLPLPVVIVSPNVSFVAAILAIAIPGSIQFFVGNVLEPKLMGRSLDLHPVIILLSLIFWGMIWGIVGMLLATPMTAVAKILFEKLPTTRPLADLMAGRLDAVLAPAPD
jgi:AI-2 transport protein TqsA